MLLKTIDFIIKNFFSAKIPLTSTLSQPKKSAIRVGSDYQVLTLPEPKGRGEEVNRDLCLWLGIYSSKNINIFDIYYSD